MFKDFKKFIFKGNIIDMAIGVIIGGAFGKIDIEASRCPNCTSELNIEAPNP